MAILNHEKFKEVFDEEFKNGEGDAIERFQKAMHEASKSMVESFPIWMKFNFIANTSFEKDNADINWDYINELLNKNLAEDDYNCFGKIETKEQFADEYNKLIDAQLNCAPFRIGICKQCKEKFTLNLGEIQSYQNKELKLPKRCKYCRKGIEKPQPQPEPKIVKAEETPVKTAMQLALEKAGIM